jgi:hypothetical protein
MVSFSAPQFFGKFASQRPIGAAKFQKKAALPFPVG